MEERQYHVTYNFIKRSNRKLPITRSVVFVPCNPSGCSAKHKFNIVVVEK